MNDIVKVLLVLIGVAALAAYVQVQSYDSNEEAWAAFKRWMAEAPGRLRASYDAVNRERSVGIEVALSPRAVLDRAVEAATRAGHVLEARSENSLTFVRRDKPSSWIAIFLLLFFLLPGILYLLFGSRTLRATFAAFAGEDGGSRIVVGGDDGYTVSRLTDWARALRSEPGGEEVGAEVSTNPLD